MISRKNKEQFAETIFESTLEASIEWIRDNMKPEDVFEEDQLHEWASEKKPEDIFSAADLEAWATDNGFVKE